jgi:hypothetical protein
MTGDHGPLAVAAIDARNLHLREAVTCLVIGCASAVARRWLPGRPLRALAAPLGAIAVSVVAVITIGRGGALPLVVALAALAGGAVTGALIRDRAVAAIVPASIWLLGATIAWFAYLSMPDTEGALAALGLTVPMAVVAARASSSSSGVAVGTESAALVALLAGAIVLGGASSASWTGWWVAKLIGGAVALSWWAVAIRSSGRGRPWRGPARARRG